MEIEQKPDQIIIHCGNKIGRQNVVDCQNILVKAIHLNLPITLMAEELTQIEPVGIQLLVSLFKTGQNKNITIKWQSINDQLLTISQLLGALELLNLHAYVKNKTKNTPTHKGLALNKLKKKDNK